MLTLQNENTIRPSELPEAPKAVANVLVEPQFALFFPEELVPTLHAWMSWADPKMVLELDGFVRSIAEINK